MVLELDNALPHLIEDAELAAAAHTSTPCCAQDGLLIATSATTTPTAAQAPAERRPAIREPASADRLHRRLPAADLELGRMADGHEVEQFIASSLRAKAGAR